MRAISELATVKIAPSSNIADGIKAKVFSKQNWKVTKEDANILAREAMQILGGLGYMRGNRVERIYREVRVNAIGGGSEEIMRDLASRQYGL